MHAGKQTILSTTKIMEDALRQSEARFRHLFEYGSDAVLVFDAATRRVEDANRAAQELFGYSKVEFSVLTLADICAGEKAPEAYMPTRIRPQGADDDIASGDFKKKDGSVFPGQMRTAGFFSEGEQKIIAAVRDISEREQTSKRLRESEERYRSLVDHIAIGVALISPAMEILTLNNQMKRWYPHIDLLKQPLCYRSFNDPPRQGVCSYCPTVKTLADGEVHESITLTPAGDEIRNYRIISSPIKDDKDHVVAAIEMVEDITERLWTEEQVRTLSQQLLQAQEIERRMISYELHDRIAQNLSALKISSDMFWEDIRIEAHAPDALKEKMATYSGLIEETIKAVRELAYELQPVGLKEMGIIKALETYCGEFSENSGIRVDFQSAGMQALNPDPETAIQIYRLVQEGLNNIKKHAEAALATIRVIGASPHIILRIEDDGKGFDVEAREKSLTEEKRMGLRSMRERTHLLGGEMTLRSRPMAGTRVVIKIPVKEQSGGS
ncbi:MAG: PAS domain S-box protein [Thermodesulfobacteriota bacterium]